MNIEALERLIAVRFPGVITLMDSVALVVGRFASLPSAATSRRGALARTEGTTGVADALRWQRKNTSDTQEWTYIPTLPDPGADRLVMWDDSEGDYAGATVGTGLDLTGTTLTSTITQYTDEMARDALGTALTAGNNIDITVDDGADTITIAVETLALDDLSDVTITTQAAGDLLLATSGSAWVNAQITVRTNTTTIAGGGTAGEVTASCNAGEIVTGGGCSNETNDSVNFVISDTEPSGQGWRCRWQNAGGPNIDGKAWALCLG